MDQIKTLLRDLFNHDFADVTTSEQFHDAFFSKTLSITDLRKVHDLVASQEALGAPAAMHITPLLPPPASGGRLGGGEKPFGIMTQLHGNESAGHAGIVLAMALAACGQLKRDVIAVIGNTLAARQYFEAYASAPGTPQEIRDCYRCGLDEQGNLLPDMNRTPIDFLERTPDTHHIKRAQEIYHIATQLCGLADIHTARGNMVCYTDHSRDADLKNSPIRAVITDLTEAISAYASTPLLPPPASGGRSGGGQVKTFKGILSPLENIECQVGIEAGRHEDPTCPEVAASFTLSLLNTLGFTDITPYFKNETGIFERYSARPRITYADLVVDGTLGDDDMIYMARETASGIEEYQYDEMQAVHKGQVIAVAKPSGALLRAASGFSGIFWSKSGKLYDKDPAVGPWPIARNQMDTTKLCYPCIVSDMKVDFQ